MGVSYFTRIAAVSSAINALRSQNERKTTHSARHEWVVFRCHPRLRDEHHAVVTSVPNRSDGDHQRRVPAPPTSTERVPR